MLTENKSTTGRREKDSGFCLRRAVCGSARVLALTGSQPFTTKTRREGNAICSAGWLPVPRLTDLWEHEWIAWEGCRWRRCGWLGRWCAGRWLPRPRRCGPRWWRRLGWRWRLWPAIRWCGVRWRGCLMLGGGCGWWRCPITPTGRRRGRSRAGRSRYWKTPTRTGCLTGPLLLPTGYCSPTG